MQYEVVESKDKPGEWYVQAINYGSDGDIYGALFYGAAAQSRAEEYAAWKSDRGAGEARQNFVAE